jgi:hypothetical protein
LFLAAAVIGLEAAAALTFGLVEVTHIEPDRFVVGAGVALLMLGYAAGLVVLARGVALGRRWSRGPATATQILQGLLATSFSKGATLSIGLALALPALLVLVCLFLPSAGAVFAPEPGPEERAPDEQP